MDLPKHYGQSTLQIGSRGKQYEKHSKCRLENNRQKSHYNYIKHLKFYENSNYTVLQHQYISVNIMDSVYQILMAN